MMHKTLPGTLLMLALLFAVGQASAARQTATPYHELTLVGTMTGQFPIALVRAADGSEQILGVGDRLGDLRISTIDARSMTLQGEDGPHRVSMGTRVGTSGIHQAGSEANGHEQRYTISRALLRDIAENPHVWLSDVSLRLEVRDGYLAGYPIQSVRKNSRAAMLGLRDGDVIRAVNGVPVRQPYLFADTVNNLGEAGQITIELERAEALISLHYTIQ
ncbi:MAG: hypothetical protein JSW10_02120 [Pseudomonadota bacterium]|nr:MAG: hypothetical protein JSW10_02120 [Pseudomonadota bacterium]